jgi:hypothetical protein
MRIDDKINQWLSSLPVGDLEQQKSYIIEFNKHMTLGLALWYTKTSYEMHEYVNHLRGHYK